MTAANVKRTLGSTLLVAALAACGNPEPQPTLFVAREGKARVLRVVAEPAGLNCVAGGQRIDYGIDDNGDGVLSDSAAEVDGCRYACADARGPNGPVGLRPGPRLSITTAVLPGDSRCSYGGSEIQAGLDDDFDGVLDASEIDVTQIACDGTVGPRGPLGESPFASLTRFEPASPGTPASISFDSSPAGEGNVVTASLGAGAGIDFIATDTLGSVTDNGSGWAWYTYGVNGFHNSAVLRPVNNQTKYYALRAQGGQNVAWSSLELLDDGYWNTARITFYAFKNGVQTGSEVRNGDVPWAGSSGAVSYAFGSPAFGDADMVVIAARQADGVSPTPLAMDDIQLTVGRDCPAGGHRVLTGRDDGAGDGTPGDGVLQAGEVEATAVVCSQ